MFTEQLISNAQMIDDVGLYNGTSTRKIDRLSINFTFEKRETVNVGQECRLPFLVLTPNS